MQICKNLTLFVYVILTWKFEAFKGRRSFRQYITSNPDKYGIKMCAQVDVRMFYTSDM
jgi:hypothetical protein